MPQLRAGQGQNKSTLPQKGLTMEDTINQKLVTNFTSQVTMTFKLISLSGRLMCVHLPLHAQASVELRINSSSSKMRMSDFRSRNLRLQMCCLACEARK